MKATCGPLGTSLLWPSAETEIANPDLGSSGNVAHLEQMNNIAAGAEGFGGLSVEISEPAKDFPAGFRLRRRGRAKQPDLV